MPRALLARTAALALTLTAAAPAAASIVVFPPAASNAFIALYETGSSIQVCNITCVLVANPTREAMLPATAFTGPSSHAISAGGSVSPTAIRGFVSSQSDSAQFDLAFRDTYTVVGGGPGLFPVIARLHVTGTVGGQETGNNLAQGAVASLVGTIGEFAIDPAFSTLPTVNAFTPSSQGGVSVSQVQSGLGGTAPVEFDVMHTQMVAAGDAFDIAWLLSASFTFRADLNFENTAAISFETPQGVFLDAASGARFGDLPDALPAVPEPSTWALMIGGFGLAGATLRARRRSALRSARA